MAPRGPGTTLPRRPCADVWTGVSEGRGLRPEGSGRLRDPDGGAGEGPRGLPEAQLPIPGEPTQGALGTGAWCRWPPRDRPSLRPPTASSRRTPRTRRWRGSTATPRGPSPGGWSCGGEWGRARAGRRAGRDGQQPRGGERRTTLPSARRDPSVKRTLCRGCSSLLIPGLTCTQRQRRECGRRRGGRGGRGRRGPPASPPAGGLRARLPALGQQRDLALRGSPTGA